MLRSKSKISCKQTFHPQTYQDERVGGDVGVDSVHVDVMLTNQDLHLAVFLHNECLLEMKTRIPSCSYEMRTGISIPGGGSRA